MEADDQDESADDDVEHYSFLMEEEPIVSQLTDSVRSLLQRPGLPPETISRIGVLLFAMERLPLVTPNVMMSLRLVYQVDRELDWMEITFDSDNFRLGKGFHTYSPGIGGDTHSEIILEAGIGYRDGDTFQAYEFAEAFSAIALEPERSVVIEDNSDEPFKDWDLESDPDAWGRLDSDYI